MSIRSVDIDISAEHMKALYRFNETCQDGQEYDVCRRIMKSMTYAGLVRWCGGSRFEITDFGIAVLDEESSHDQ